MVKSVWGEKSTFNLKHLCAPLLHSLPSPEHPQVNSRVLFPSPGLEFHLVWAPHFIGESTWSSEREGPHSKSDSRTRRIRSPNTQPSAFPNRRTWWEWEMSTADAEYRTPSFILARVFSYPDKKIDALYWVLYLVSGTRVSPNISLNIVTLQGRYYCAHLQMRKLKIKKFIN